MKNAEYVGAICSSREKYLISQDKFDKMLSMSLKDAVKQIKDGGFGKGEDSYEAEKLISAEEENFINFIKEYAPNKEFIAYKLLSYDYHNANAILRAVNLGLNVSKVVGRQGNYSIEELTSFISGENTSGDNLSKYLKEAIISGKKLFSENKATGVALDLIFIKAKYAESLNLVKKVKTLKTFVKAEIDASNLTTALRSSTEEGVKNAFIDGGNITESDILYIYSEKKIPSSLKGLEIEKALSSAITASVNQKAFVEFENFAQSYPLKTLMKDKYVVEGFDIFYLYCLYKENEIKNVRILTVGLSAGLSVADIKARLRVNYAG